MIVQTGLCWTYQNQNCWFSHAQAQFEQIFYKGISREATEALSDASRLSGVESHKEVLARWSDDGWYYHGHVIKEGKHKCIIQDATGYHEGITKEDIIVEADHNFDIIQVNMLYVLS